MPIFVLMMWGALSWCFIAISPTSGAGWGLSAIGLFLTFAFSHLLAVSSVAGFGLLMARQAPRPAFTLLSAVVGALVSVFVFSRIYFDVGS